MKVRLLHRCLLVVFFFGFAVFASSSSSVVWSSSLETSSVNFILDFEDGANRETVRDKYASLGVKFEGASFLRKGDTLNYEQFPPHSGLGVIYDGADAEFYGGVNIYFDQLLAGSVREVRFFVTTNSRLTVKAYDKNGNSVDQAELSPNHIFEGEPNKEVVLRSVVPIHKLTFNSHYKQVNHSVFIPADDFRGEIDSPGMRRWNTFTVDDFEFSASPICSLGVKHFLQTDSAWAGDHYGQHGWVSPDSRYPANIKNWGCALVSSVMLLNYYGFEKGTSTNPGELNQWLKHNNGYSGGYILFSQVARYGRDVMKLDLWFNGQLSQRNDKVVGAYICNGFPVVLHVNSSRGMHFVVANSYASGVFGIKDPWSTDETLGLQYHGEYRSSRHFSNVQSNAVLEVVVHSQTEVLLTDSMGRSIGYDRGVFKDEIPASNYYVDQISPFESQLGTMSSKRIEVWSLNKGAHALTLRGTDLGMFSATLFVSTDNAVFRKDFSGITEEGHLIKLSFFVDPDVEAGESPVKDYEASETFPFNPKTGRINLPMILR